MRQLKTKAEVRRAVAAAREKAAEPGWNGEEGVALVPTMGYLHEGHASLVRRARQENGLVVMSIFVNPAQFAPHEDYAEYPRDLERDLFLAEEEGVDLVFHPTAQEMYRPGHATWVDVEGLTEHLCGASRPGHFRGVATVVAKLLGICRPDRLYLGQKDAQQAFVIRRMVRDLDMDVEVVVCPTVRESDGLALSSRNVYLTPQERAQATALHRALRTAEARIEAGEREARVIVQSVLEVLSEATLGRVDYVEVVDTETLQPLETLAGEVLVALAVWFGGTRLIDNLVVAIG